MQPQQVNPLVNMMPIFLIFIIFYFLLIRPQQKKQAEHQKMVAALKKNDEVVTSGGIHGVVVNVKDNSIVLKIADEVKVEVQKSSVSSLKKSAEQ
jgi:preprotein translocase subunit YajC